MWIIYEAFSKYIAFMAIVQKFTAIYTIFLIVKEGFIWRWVKKELLQLALNCIYHKRKIGINVNWSDLSTFFFFINFLAVSKISARNNHMSYQTFISEIGKPQRNFFSAYVNCLELFFLNRLEVMQKSVCILKCIEAEIVGEKSQFPFGLEHFESWHHKVFFRFLFNNNSPIKSAWMSYLREKTAKE